jgi:sulfur relay (sulfurtransferase) complex TusBCD TusD component (DsrE family)
MGLFKRLRTRGKASVAPVAAVSDLALLGGELVALQLASGAEVPAQCTAVVVAESGQTRRVGAFGAAQVSLGAGEVAWCFHPGPYALAVLPFAAAPEAGLRLEFVVDAGDPRVAQQRFDLFLASEMVGGDAALSVSSFAAAVQAALQIALAEGMLDLPPCTSLGEWHAFRAGLNELLYTRFGVTVEDCYPIDLHPATDFAATLRARRAASAPPADAAPSAVASSPAAPALDAGAGSTQGEPAPVSARERDLDVAAHMPAYAERDAHAVRRLFLELPALSTALRMITPPSNAFATRQELLQRLALAALDVNTMPALELAAPDRKLSASAQARRAVHASQAATALNNAWSLIARLKLAQADEFTQLFDEADRVIANLEFALAERRAVPTAARALDAEAGQSAAVRREPTLGKPK